MEKVVNKYYIKGKEVTLVAERYATKIYKGDSAYYVTNYEEVVAEFDTHAVIIPKEVCVKHD